MSRIIGQWIAVNLLAKIADRYGLNLCDTATLSECGRHVDLDTRDIH